MSVRLGSAPKSKSFETMYAFSCLTASCKGYVRLHHVLRLLLALPGSKRFFFKKSFTSSPACWSSSVEKADIGWPSAAKWLGFLSHWDSEQPFNHSIEPRHEPPDPITISIYIYMFYIYIQIYMYVCMYMYIYISSKYNMHMYIYIYMYVNVIKVYIYICIYTYIRIMKLICIYQYLKICKNYKIHTY